MLYQDSPMTTPSPPVGKRFFELIVTTSVMPIILPVIAGLALTVWAFHGLPIFSPSSALVSMAARSCW